MARESIIEIEPFIGLAKTGTITVTSGSTTVSGVGTLFTSELNTASFIQYTDDNGVGKIGAIASITNDAELVLHNTPNSDATGVSFSGGTIRTPYFIADNTALKAGIVANIMQGFTLVTPLNKSKISKDEGLLLKTVYMRLPYQYTMADSRISVGFAYLSGDDESLLGVIPSIGETDSTISGVFIPGENSEIDVNAYIPPPSNAPDSGWILGAYIRSGISSPAASLSVDAAAISQVDAPDALNGEVLPVIFGARILHAGTVLS